MNERSCIGSYLQNPTPENLGQVAETCGERLHRLCLRTTRGNRHDADDAVQDAYVQLLKQPPARWTGANPVGYFCTNVRWKARDGYRSSVGRSGRGGRGGVRRRESLDAIQGGRIDGSTASVGAESLPESERVLAFRRALQGLSHNQRYALALRTYARMNRRLIGRALGLSESGVSTTIKHAKVELKRLFDAELERTGDEYNSNDALIAFLMSRGGDLTVADREFLAWELAIQNEQEEPHQNPPRVDITVRGAVASDYLDPTVRLKLFQTIACKKYREYLLLPAFYQIVGRAGFPPEHHVGVKGRSILPQLQEFAEAAARTHSRVRATDAYFVALSLGVACRTVGVDSGHSHDVLEFTRHNPSVLVDRLLAEYIRYYLLAENPVQTIRWMLPQRISHLKDHWLNVQERAELELMLVRNLLDKSRASREHWGGSLDAVLLGCR